MNTTYLLLGSNMGNSQLQLSYAIEHINKKIGTVLRKSSLYATAAWGNTNQPDFLNQVIFVGTEMGAQETLQTILSIEAQMGRIRTIKNAPRVIDIDILFFNKQIINSENLTIPHPEIKNRRFALIPLNELSPNFKHPVFSKSLHTMLTECSDELNVKKF